MTQRTEGNAVITRHLNLLLSRLAKARSNLMESAERYSPNNVELHCRHFDPWLFSKEFEQWAEIHRKPREEFNRTNLYNALAWVRMKTGMDTEMPTPGGMALAAMYCNDPTDLYVDPIRALTLDLCEESGNR